MAENSRISWTDHTFNPWIGCARVSPACDGCYAAAMMGDEGRHKRAVWGGPGKGNGTRVRTAPSTWNVMHKLNRRCAAAGRRDFVFCASLADVADKVVPIEWLAALLQLVFDTPNLTYLFLTKRPQLLVSRIGEVLAIGGMSRMPRNIALGTTIEDRKRLALNAPALEYARDMLRPVFTFWSCEPLLEDLGPDLRLPDWVITGHETDQGGHKARPTHPAWLRSIRDQCAAAAVPYHHKQNGEWLDAEQHDPREMGCEADPAAIHITGAREFRPSEAARLIVERGNGWAGVCRVGKKRSGRLLDGVLHDARPDDSNLGIWR